MRYNRRGLGYEQRNAVDAFAQTQGEHHLLQFCIARNPDSMRHVGDETGSREHLITIVDPDQKFGRPDKALNRAELHALDLTRYRSQLTRRINFSLYSAARIFLNRRY